MMERIEDIILKYSGRGMDVLRNHMGNCYAEDAAKMILSWPKGNVLLATGFYVEGFAETDGPVGTLALAFALKKLGFNPFILTDFYTKSFFDGTGIKTIFMSISDEEEWCKNILSVYNPVGLISIERCGKNLENEYVNMKGISISECTPKMDMLFDFAYKKIPTIGIGDGGNEIGMGNEAELISRKLSLTPCVVKVSQLVIATVSNWGAYGVVAYLEKLSGEKVFMPFKDVRDFIAKTVEMGSVDGVLKMPVVSVDGFGMEVEKEIIGLLESKLC